MEKQKPSTTPPEVADRNDVHLVSSRCPFCHVSVPASESVACQGCLARHHPACWDEAGKCASCASRQALRPEPRKITRVLVQQLLGEAGFSAAEIEDYLASAASTGTRAQALCPERTQGVLCNRAGAHHFGGAWLCAEHAAGKHQSSALVLKVIGWLLVFPVLLFTAMGFLEDPEAFIGSLVIGSLAAVAGIGARYARRRADSLRALTDEAPK